MPLELTKPGLEDAVANRLKADKELNEAVIVQITKAIDVLEGIRRILKDFNNGIQS